VEMALGLTEASRKKTTKAVQRALGKGGATAEQLQQLAEELLRTSAANREAMTKLVRYELDRALGGGGASVALGGGLWRAGWSRSAALQALNVLDATPANAK